MSKKIFCTIPWNHLFVRSDEKFSFCCTTSHYDEQSKNFEEYWNSPDLREIRVALMKGELPPEKWCSRCIGERTMKSSFAERSFDKNRPYIDEFLSKTDEEGYTSYLPKTIEIRTDLCNFKCRTCSDLHSSSIRAERVKYDMRLVSESKGSINDLESCGLTDEFLKNLIHVTWSVS